MKHKRKLKKSVIYSISAILLVVICIIFSQLLAKNEKPEQNGEPAGQTKEPTVSVEPSELNHEAANQTEESQQEESNDSHAQMIEEEGDIEVIVPEDQESGGF